MIRRVILPIALALTAIAARPASDADDPCCDSRLARRVTGSMLLWPRSPEVPRIEYVSSLASEVSLGKGQGTFARLRRVVTGSRAEILTIQRPHDVVVDARDRVYVTDGTRRAVLLFDGRGQQAREIGAEPGPGMLSKPMGLGIDNRDRVFVADQGAKRVVMFGADGAFVRAFGGESVLLNPVDVAVDNSTGVVYVADSYLHQVIAFNPDGTILRRLGRNVGNLEAKRESMSRALSVSSHDPSTAIATATMDSAMRTVLGHSGKYLAESRDLVENRGGKLGEFRYPSFLAVGEDGTLYVTDAMNFRVQLFDRAGKPLGQIGKLGDSPGSFARPKGVAVDSEDHVYVVDAAFNNVQVFDRDGHLLLAFAALGRGVGDLWLPLGMSIDKRDRVLIADRFNNRVQIYHYLTRQEGADILSTLAAQNLK